MNPQLLIPFLQLTISHIAVSHLSRPTGESSMMLPVFSVNCGAACLARQCQRLYFSKNRTSLLPQTRASYAIGPAARHQILTAVGWIVK